MKFTANLDCATEGLAERTDRYDETARKDEYVRECLSHIKDKIGCIRDVLTRCRATQEDIELLKDLDNDIVDYQTNLIDLLAGKAHMEINAAYHAGLMYGQLRDHCQDQAPEDGGRRE